MEWRPLPASSSGRCEGGVVYHSNLSVHVHRAHDARLHLGQNNGPRAPRRRHRRAREKKMWRKGGGRKRLITTGLRRRTKPVATGPSSWVVVAVARAWSGLPSSGACTRWAPPCWARCCSSPGSNRAPARWCGRWFGSRVAPWGRRPSSRT